MEPPDLAGQRKSYDGAYLAESALAPDPMTQFHAWYAEAAQAGIDEPNAMVLGTASASGLPGTRIVLLKGYGPDGFRFFTNHTSQKGRDLTQNLHVSLLFPWHPIRRQVIVSGDAVRLPATESERYFHSRPHGSQLGAWASEHQSAVIGSRAELDRRFAELAERWPEGARVPLPEFWGGYRVVPQAVEFWQGGPNRLHDRLRYRRELGAWVLERLSP